MKLKVDLWLDYSYFVFGMGQYTLFAICAGLNPLSRTIQGNDPGTTACPPSAQAGIG